jgi:hypothetical protein
MISHPTDSDLAHYAMGESPVRVTPSEIAAHIEMCERCRGVLAVEQRLHEAFATPPIAHGAHDADDVGLDPLFQRILRDAEQVLGAEPYAGTVVEAAPQIHPEQPHIDPQGDPAAAGASSRMPWRPALLWLRSDSATSTPRETWLWEDIAALDFLLLHVRVEPRRRTAGYARWVMATLSENDYERLRQWRQINGLKAYLSELLTTLAHEWSTWNPPSFGPVLHSFVGDTALEERQKQEAAALEELRVTGHEVGYRTLVEAADQLPARDQDLVWRHVTRVQHRYVRMRSFLAPELLDAQHSPEHNPDAHLRQVLAALVRQLIRRGVPDYSITSLLGVDVFGAALEDESRASPEQQRNVAAHVQPPRKDPEV